MCACVHTKAMLRKFIYFRQFFPSRRRRRFYFVCFHQKDIIIISVFVCRVIH